MRSLSALCVALVLAVAVPIGANGAQPKPFFAGKTIYLAIGYGPGGANDVWGRTIAKHLGNHIEGRPRVIVQNVPGAGGLTLMNQLYNISPKDGTFIGLINRGLPFEPLLGGDGVQFDPLKMNWLGSPDRDTTVCVARKDAAVETMRDLLERELLVGATGSGADTAIYPEFLSQLLSMKFKIIKGYQGTKDISLAMERGEVEGQCLAYDSLLREPLAREGRVSILFQAALSPDERLKQVPVVTDLARSEADREALALFFARVELGRPLVLPPGVPADRVAVLRNALRETLGDSAFRDDARKLDLSIDYIDAEQLRETIAAAYRAPKEIVQRTKDALGRVARQR